MHQLYHVIIAHELGHTLGAYHTFSQGPGDPAPHKNPPQAGNGLMDYKKKSQGYEEGHSWGGEVQFHTMHEPNMCKLLDIIEICLQLLAFFVKENWPIRHKAVFPFLVDPCKKRTYCDMVQMGIGNFQGNEMPTLAPWPTYPS